METGKPEEVESLNITFQSEDDIIHFVDTCNRYDDAIDVVLEKRSTDAKSILGIFSLDWSKPVTMEIYSDDCDDLLAEIKPFLA